MPWGLKRFQQTRQLHLPNFQLLQTTPKFPYARISRHIRIGAGTGSTELQPLHLRLRSHARTCPRAGKRARARNSGTSHAIAETGSRSEVGSTSRRFILASPLLRLQCVGRKEIHRKAPLHSSKSGGARFGRAPRGLGLEQLSSLFKRRRGTGRDRVAVDSPKARAQGDLPYREGAGGKSQPKQSLSGAPSRAISSKAARSRSISVGRGCPVQAPLGLGFSYPDLQQSVSSTVNPPPRLISSQIIHSLHTILWPAMSHSPFSSWYPITRK
jgi:hypothetical protein